jgi:Ni,Fe-hydrogenase I small subunit
MSHEKKLLGCAFNFESDTFALNKIDQKIANINGCPIKRQVLQITIAIYDPLGLIEFFRSKLKLLYHSICKDNLAWEDHINAIQYKTWVQILRWQFAHPK